MIVVDSLVPLDCRGLEEPNSLTFHAIQKMPPFFSVEEEVHLVRYMDNKQFWAVKAHWFEDPTKSGGCQPRIAYFDAFTGEYLSEV